MIYQCTKTYETGFSCAFRQWRATSHCRFVHGYGLSFKFIFEAKELDDKNWVVDFGDLKGLKNHLEDYFDHKTVIAFDDPHKDYFLKGNELGVLDLIIVEDTGCEKFAHLAYIIANKYLENKNYSPRCKLLSVEVSEHSGNSALFIP